ncbi:MAG TPA: hypothetical protein VH331_18825 [Allosphingosinicella sp.]|jgi:hypothetical protein|nr:hypothetical protein [Allosphingosinicella sp.]
MHEAYSTKDQVRLILIQARMIVKLRRCSAFDQARSTGYCGFGDRLSPILHRLCLRRKGSVGDAQDRE